jgi:hypothetical protein
MTTYDGVQGTYSLPIGDWDTSVSYYYGNSKFDAVSNDNEDKTTLAGREDSEFEYDALTGIVFNASYDWLRIRATYTHSENKDNFSDGDNLDNITVGLRWDFHPSAAIKFEYSENDVDAGAGGTDSDAELLAMSIDVFSNQGGCRQ